MRRHLYIALLLGLAVATPLPAQYQAGLSNRSAYIDGYIRRHSSGGDRNSFYCRRWRHRRKHW